MDQPNPSPSAELTKLSRRVSVLEKEIRELSGAVLMVTYELVQRAQREGGQQ